LTPGTGGAEGPIARSPVRGFRGASARGILHVTPRWRPLLSSAPDNLSSPRRDGAACSLGATLAQLRGLIRRLEPDPSTVNPIAIEPPPRSLRRMQIES